MKLVPAIRAVLVIVVVLVILALANSVIPREPNDNVTIVNASDQDLMTRRANGDGEWYDAQELPARGSVTFAIGFNKSRCTSHLGIRVVDSTGLVIQEFTTACAGDRLTLKVP